MSLQVQKKDTPIEVKLDKGVRLIWLATGFLEVLIALRILLKMFAANLNNPFTQFINHLSYLFLWPFLGSSEPSLATRLLIEFGSFFAMSMYIVLAATAIHLLRFVVTTISTRPIAQLIQEPR